MADPCFLGVDGGGTKTRAVLLDDQLSVRGRGEGGPSNGSTQPLERAAKSIRDAIEGALAEARRPLADVAGIVLGLAGVEAPGPHARVLGSLASEYGAERVFLTTDGRVALAGATEDPLGGPAVILMAGTGAIAHGRDAAGREARASGMGWLIGDEGSGYWMARRALEAVARELDGRGPATAIRSVLRERHGIDGPDALLAAVYRSGTLPAGVAAYYPVVLEAAARGDSVARAILGDAADELALAAVTVVRKLGLEGGHFPVALSGGVLAPEAPISPLVAARIARAAPGAAAGPPLHPPEVGAARLARARCQRKER